MLNKVKQSFLVLYAWIECGMTPPPPPQEKKTKKVFFQEHCFIQRLNFDQDWVMWVICIKNCLMSQYNL